MFCSLPLQLAFGRIFINLTTYILTILVCISKFNKTCMQQHTREELGGRGHQRKWRSVCRQRRRRRPYRGGPPTSRGNGCHSMRATAPGPSAVGCRFGAGIREWGARRAAMLASGCLPYHNSLRAPASRRPHRPPPPPSRARCRRARGEMSPLGEGTRIAI
jgi:hypothetical protein